jgi:hypothetical protein
MAQKARVHLVLHDLCIQAQEVHNCEA